MLRFVFAALLALSGLMAGTYAQTDGATAPDRTETLTLSTGARMDIEYHLPDDFDPHRSYPVMISVGTFFLHDDPAEFGWVIVRAGVEESQYSVAESAEALDHLAEQINVRGGFHIFGYSASSAGVFRIASALPDRFDGVLVMPGHPRRAAQYEPLRETRIRFIVGENDGYWLRESRQAHERFQAMGTDTQIEIIENGGHVLAELSGRPLFERIDRWFGEADGTHHAAGHH